MIPVKAGAYEHMVTLAWYPGLRESAWYTLMHFLLIENGVAHVYDINTIQVHVL